MRFWAGIIMAAGLATPASADDRPARVLVLNSYTPTFPTSGPLLDAIADELPGVVLDVEFLGSKAAWNNEYAEMSLRPIAARLARRPPYDVIITTDDHAIDLVLLDGGEVFDAPVVSVGVNDGRKLEAGSHPRGLTGAIEHIDLVGTLDLARSLQPELSQVSLVVDGSASGDAHLAVARAQLKPSGIAVREVSLSVSDTATIEQQLAYTPDRAHAVIVLSAHITEGVEERFDTVHRRLCHDGNRWCYTPFTFALDAGVVGGSVIDMADHGRIAGAYARRILDGAAVSDLPVTTTGFQTVVTREALRHHPEISVPPGASLVPPRSWWGVWVGLATGGGVLSLVAVVGLFALRRRRAPLSEEDVRLAEVGRVAVSVAHDLNNLLTVVQSYQDLIEMDAGLSDQLREDLSEMGAANQRAARLVKRVLMWGSDRQERRQPVVVGEHIADLTAVLRRLLGHEVELHRIIDAEALAVSASPTSLDQLLLNLISNARDAGARSVQLEVCSRPLTRPVPLLSDTVDAGDWVVIRVLDDGRGLDDAAPRQMLRRGFSTKGHAGTGVGLDTVVHLVREEGGAFDLKSRPQGGAEAELWLPRLPDDEARPIRAPVLAAFQALRGTEHLWIIDDDPDVRRVLARTCTGFGYSTTPLATGADALEQLESAPRPDLALVDVGLRAMRGPQLVVRLQERLGPFPVLYLSGSGETLDDPSLPVVEKPFDTQALLATLRSLLDAR